MSRILRIANIALFAVATAAVIGVWGWSDDIPRWQGWLAMTGSLWLATLLGVMSIPRRADTAS